MILVARAPFCLNLGGRGTDFAAYYERYGGVVVSAAINVYFYLILSSNSGDGVQIISADHRAFSHRPAQETFIGEDALSLPRAITYYFNIRDGVDLFLASQVPPNTGLSLSGALSVAMIKGLAFWSGLDLGSLEVAELACNIEIERLAAMTDKQGKYASAFGGLNAIKLSRGSVGIEPLRLTSKGLETLNRGLLLFYLGDTRKPTFNLNLHQRLLERKDKNTLLRLDALKEMAQQIGKALVRENFREFGELMYCSWVEERKLMQGVFDPAVDRYYQMAMDNGAWGGRVILGEEGGFLLFFCSLDQQKSVCDALSSVGLRRRLFEFVSQGVQVLPLAEMMDLEGWPHLIFETQNIVG